MKNNSLIYIFTALLLSMYGLSCKGQVINSNSKMDKKTNRELLLTHAFPVLKAQTLSKQDIVFPTDCLGKPTVLCLVFDREAQALVDTWTTPILEKYYDKSVNYYEIPMINMAWGAMSNFIDDGMRSGVPKDLHDNVATYYGSLSFYKSELQLEDPNSCYLFLLDQKGIIQFTTEYTSSAEKLAALYAAIDKMNGL